MSETKDPAAQIAEIEARRAERKKNTESKQLVQKAVDMAALEQLEIEHGEDNLAILEIPQFTPDCVTLVVARCPTTPEIKRYRYRASDRTGKRNETITGDRVAAAEELGESCLKYPSREEFDKVCDARPGLKAQLGALAVTLVVGDAKS